MFEQSMKEGQESELKFSQLAKLRGFLVEPATGMESPAKHFHDHVPNGECKSLSHGHNRR